MNDFGEATQVFAEENIVEVPTENDDTSIKRTTPVCYYVMNYAEYGDLYQLCEVSEQLSEPLVRHLFR